VAFNYAVTILSDCRQYDELFILANGQKLETKNIKAFSKTNSFICIQYGVTDHRNLTHNLPKYHYG
jgi:hypothetical protein